MMKTSYLWYLLIFLVGCKASSVTSTTTTYTEDLTQYRKELAGPTPDTAIGEPVETEAIVLEGHIGAELDSVLTMIVDRNASRGSWDGYTIQMYSGLSRDDAYAARDQAVDLDLDLDPKIEYYQPNYRVKGGHFFDRLEAYRTYKEVKEAFPQALLLPAKLSLNNPSDD